MSAKTAQAMLLGWDRAKAAEPAVCPRRACRGGRIATLIALEAALALVHAQARAEKWVIEPRVTVRETWTDNVGLEPKGSERSDLITELAPGLSIRGASARAKLDLDYQLTNLSYARSGKGSEFQNALNAFGTVEAIERFLFVDARALVTQQTISAFDVQPSSNSSDTANRTETRLFSLSPYVKGMLGSDATYDLRFTESVLRAKSASDLDSNVRKWDGRIASPGDRPKLGWQVEYKNETSDFSDRGDTTYRLTRGTLSYRFDPEWRVFARAGREDTNALPGKESFATHGAGIEWSPSERTKLAAESDRRYFGRAYLYSLQHRAQRAALKVELSRYATTSAEQLGGDSSRAVFNRLMDSLAATIPDPIQRADQARQLLQGVGTSDQFSGKVGFLSNQVTVDTRAELSVAWTGLRDTISFVALRRQARPLGPVLASDADFLQASSVRQVGFGLDWAHKLGQLTSFGSAANWQRNTGDGASSVETNLWAFTLFLSRQLGPKTSAAASYRFARSTGTDSAGYRENALVATLTHRF